MFCLSEQFGATSVRGATAVAMQNELSMYVVVHLKAPRLCLGDLGSGHWTILILPCVWIHVWALICRDLMKDRKS